MDKQTVTEGQEETWEGEKNEWAILTPKVL